MKAPARPSNPAPIMKPPPHQPNAPTELAKVQPTQKPGFKGPPANVTKPAGFKGPPEGIVVPPWQPANPPVMPSSSPAGVKANFKGPPKGHPDYQEVPITYLPYTPKAGTPKKPPPLMPADKLFKPPPAPGYGGLSRADHAIAQEIYERELANRRARANRRCDDEDDDHRYYNTGSASSGTQPGDRAAAAAGRQDEKERGNPFGRSRTNKMSSEYAPPPAKSGPVSRLTTPLLRV
eukprot:6456506-Amphidinium_carterae.1